jgi:hypothetical protein
VRPSVESASSPKATSPNESQSVAMCQLPTPTALRQDHGLDGAHGKHHSAQGENMTSSQKLQRRRPGRPLSTGGGIFIGVRILPQLLIRIDEWRKAQRVPPSRPAALRHLAEVGLDTLVGLGRPKP